MSLPATLPGHGGGTDLCNGATLGVKGTWGAGDVFASWLSSRSNSGATALADQTLTPALLAGYQVIIAEDVSHNHQYSADGVKALSDCVSKGGGFMTLIGYSQDSTEIDNVNRLLAPFSMSYGADHILPQGNGNSTVPIAMWNPHPIDTGVTAVGIDNDSDVRSWLSLRQSPAGIGPRKARFVRDLTLSKLLARSMLNCASELDSTRRFP